MKYSCNMIPEIGPGIRIIVDSDDVIHFIVTRFINIEHRTVDVGGTRVINDHIKSPKSCQAGRLPHRKVI